MTAMAAGRARSRWGRWDGRPRTRAHPRFPAGARASRGCARWTDRAGCSRALVCPRRCVDRVGGAGGDHSTPASPSPSGSFTSVAGGRLRLLRRRGEIGGRGMGAATCPAPAWARGVGGGTGLVGRVGGVGSGGRVVGAFDRLLPRRRRRDLATAPGPSALPSRTPTGDTRAATAPSVPEVLLVLGGESGAGALRQRQPSGRVLRDAEV